MDRDSAKFLTIVLAVFLVALIIAFLALQFASHYAGAVDRARGVTDQITIWLWRNVV